MKRYWKHMLTWFLALAMALSTPLLTEGTARAEDYGRTTETGVRLRKGPSTGYDYWFRLPIDYVCAYTETETDSSGVTWYKVSVPNPETSGSKIYTGYLHGSYFVPISLEEAEAAGVNSAGAAATGAATGTDTTGTTTGMTTLEKLRELTGLTPPDQKSSGEAASSSTAASTGATTTGSIMIDELKELTGLLPSNTTTSGEAAPASAATSAGSTTAAVSGSYGYVKTKVKGVNLRSKPAGAIQEKISPIGTVLPVTGESVSKQHYTWYPVQTASGHRGYLRGDCVEVCDANGNTVSSASATTSPDTATTSSYTATTSPDTATTSSYTANTSPDTATASSYTAVTSTDTVTEKMISADTASSEGTVCGYVRTTKGSVNVRSKPAGSILGKVRKGLVFAYYEKKTSGGYTWYKVNTTFGVGYLRGDCVTETDQNGTTAGTTVTTGTTGTTDAQNYADLSMTIYPAEKIDWFKGGIQELIPKGSNFKIYDVKTGIVWWAHRWSGGKHADIETLTAADTARLCKIYGVSSAKQITDWQRRPCLITVGNRTFACALYGVPHNSSGDTIADNNLDGQICLHFTNSRTHGSNKVVSYNEEAIEYAWLNAPNGHK